jgi:adenylate kinase family enzyme
MKKRIHIFGASGSGSTTIASEIAANMGYTHFDADDYFWEKTEIPFTRERDAEERLRLLQADMDDHETWILSGSVTGWGERELTPRFDLVVFVYVPQEERIERLKHREKKRYGDRILPGGDLHMSYLVFVDWAAGYDAGTKTGRNLMKHEAFLQTIQVPVLRIENRDLAASVRLVEAAIRS